MLLASSVDAAMTANASPHVVRFGDFEVDLRSGELRKRGIRIALQGRPLQVLEVLLGSPGELVTRETLRQKLWGGDTFVDFETGLNAAVRRLREALGDAAGVPKFVETLPRRGYRFIMPLQGARHSPAVPPSAAPVRLAVLPFVNLTGEAGRDYLADGLAEETTATLARVDPVGIVVIGRTSMMRYKATTRSLAEIGAELDADYLVESSIRVEQDRLRVTAALVRTRDEIQVWTGSYERELANVLALQTELGAGIAEQIGLCLSPQRRGPFARSQTSNPAAYDRYLRGLFRHRHRNPASNAAAVRLFEEAIALDPNFALAWSRLAAVHATSGLNGDAAPAASAPLARMAAEHAITADPRLAEAQMAVAQVRFWFDWDWAATAAALDRAITLDPACAGAHGMRAFLCSNLGRHADAIAATERGIELDPLNPMQHDVASEVAFRRRDYEAAVIHAQRSIDLDAGLWVGHILAAQACEQLGESRRALEMLTDAERLSGGNSKVISLRGYILARTGQVDGAQAAIWALSETAAAHYVPPYATALIHAGLGDPDASFEWLEQAYAVRDIHLTLLPIDPKWDACRADRRFESLLARCAFTASEPGASGR